MCWIFCLRGFRHAHTARKISRKHHPSYETLHTCERPFGSDIFPNFWRAEWAVSFGLRDVLGNFGKSYRINVQKLP